VSRAGGRIGVYPIRRRRRLTGSDGTALRVARWALHDGTRDAEAECAAIREELMVPEVGVEPTRF
jgi:hypothetical protein